MKATKYVPVNFGLPLIEKASVEENEELHTKWANLLSNALDPDYDGDMQRSFVSILADLEPLDARIADEIIKIHQASANLDQLFDLTKLAEALRISRSRAEMSVRNLVRLGIFKPGVVVSEGIRLGGEPATAYKDIAYFGVTNTGIQFVRAVNVPHAAK